MSDAPDEGLDKDLDKDQGEARIWAISGPMLGPVDSWPF